MTRLPAATGLLCAAVFLSLIATTPARAGRSEAEGDVGRSHYVRYCASCHGMDALGRGPVAGELKKPPTDLTRIAARHKGRFRDAEIAAYIDGRADVPAHGTREMPSGASGSRPSTDPTASRRRSRAGRSACSSSI